MGSVSFWNLIDRGVFNVAKIRCRKMNIGGTIGLVIFVIGVIVLVLWSLGNQAALLPGLIITGAGLVIMWLLGGLGGSGRSGG